VPGSGAPDSPVCRQAGIGMKFSVIPAPPIRGNEQKKIIKLKTKYEKTNCNNENDP